MIPTALKVEPVEECVIVGGCGGLYWIPVAQQADYYCAQRYMTMLGLVCLPILLFFLNC